ncbi:hypothetical protein [Streptomyces sp. V1I1]|uniref:hypothetical protein n=1 Tax=Streptomyces sp. V1I1 TaxID=3042272 RepID=UPI00277F82CB|nr:hypothetical protein [Streptomyces sp. V1I1]MDQ0940340.1 hypothetical protein [Streptomyces sp. V1I1]
MPHCIAQLLTLLLRLLLPPHGRHRTVAHPLVNAATTPPAAPTPTFGRRPCPTALRSEDAALIRPYPVAHEQLREEWLQALRHRAMLVASCGIDVERVQVHRAGVAR